MLGMHDTLTISLPYPPEPTHLEDAAAGFPDYGMSVNPAKTRVTFDLRPGPGAPRLPRNTVTDGCGAEFVPWCARCREGVLVALGVACLHGCLYVIRHSAAAPW